MKKTEDMQDIFDRLETSYGPAYLQDIQDRLNLCEAREIQYLEMKQIIEILARFRNRVRVMIRNYRSWKAAYDSENDQIEKVYKAYDGIFMRRQMDDAWKMYIMVNKDYHELRRMYLASMRRIPYTQSGTA